MLSKIDPYRIFFPMGLLFSIWGTALWVGPAFFKLAAYPSVPHSEIMIGGFLFAFATGFLMTAVPRFTGTDRAQTWELITAFLLFVGLALALIGGHPVYFYGMAMACLVFVFIFGARRFVRRGFNPPPSFVFVGLGILIGMAGLILCILSALRFVNSATLTMGRNFYFQGMMLSLILGVGTKLIPSLLGWAAPPLVQISRTGTARERTKISLQEIPILLWISLALFLISFPVESFFHLIGGRILRATVVTVIGVWEWKLLRYPRERGQLSFWLWISSWFLVLGLWGYAVSPTYGVHLLHLTFIGGFGMLTLMIATRVTLAHGSHDTDIELKSKALLWAGVFISGAAITRALAPYIPAAYLTHLGYAAACWILAVIFWSFTFLMKILRVHRHEEKTLIRKENC